MIPKIAAVAFLITLLFGTPFQAQAEDELWAAIVFASNERKPNSPALRPFEGKLKNIFGYNSYGILAQNTRGLREGVGAHLVSHKDFSVHAEGKGIVEGLHLIKLQFLQNKRLMVETMAKLGESSPLFVRGPEIGNGQLIVVLMVKEETE